MNLTPTHNHNRNRQGIALILVLIVITVLAVLAGGFASSMKTEMVLARTSNNDTEYLWLGRSGVELARYVVGQQLNIQTEPYDSLGQKWAGGMQDTNEIFANVSLTNVELGPGIINVKIIDQERFYNINAADDVTLRQAFTLVGIDSTEMPMISDCIHDWIDPDDQPHMNGAENEYYLGLNPPYLCKNGPIDDITELLLIKGITSDMYFGTTPDAYNVPVSSTGRKLAVSHYTGPVYSNALADMFRPLSSRKININTASALVLQLIPGIDANVAAGIIKQRSGPDGQDGTEDDTPFRSVGELVSVPGISRQAASSGGNVFTVRSATYEVLVDVRIGDRTRTMKAMIYRPSAKDVRVLYAYLQ